ncbi:hypothetical protein [Zhihengliuella sp.]|uniref:hypothetical protein n=1 Tax=Zhihengliuella sp. TaxID=1954483 RepID=UPI0028124FC2|nr:hypothetical protein [Zhihengliuella sp.]
MTELSLSQEPRTAPPGTRMAPRSRGGVVWSDEAGSAIVEFTMLGVLLLVPLVYVVLAAGQLQAASYAAVAAADHGAQVFAMAPGESAGAARANDAVQRAVANMDLGTDGAEMTYRCHDGCMSRDGSVTVTVRVPVPLPLLPPGVQTSVGSVSAESTRVFGTL